MNSSDYNLIQLINRIYLNNLCCSMPQRWAELSNRIFSVRPLADSEARYPPSLILGGWQSSDSEKRERLIAQLLYAYRRGSINEACDYLMSLADDDWYKMRG
jgi:hypothetical protein